MNAPDRLAAALERQLAAHAEPDHPEEEALFAYVDGTLARPEWEIVASHVEECDLCRDDADDLRALRIARPTGAPARVRWALAAMAASLVAVLGGVLWLGRPPAMPERVAMGHLPQQTTALLLPPAGLPPHPPRPNHGRWNALVERALTNGIARPAILDVVQFPNETLRGETLMPGHVIGPKGTAIDDARPTFRWAVPTPFRAVVYVFRDGHEVARSPELTVPQWRCDRDLPRGATYRWQVALQSGEDETILPAPPQPPADFHVIDENAYSEISEARRQFPGDHLLLGVLYARHGVLAKAEDELRSYAVEHPEPNVQKLIHTIHSWNRE